MPNDILQVGPLHRGRINHATNWLVRAPRIVGCLVRYTVPRPRPRMPEESKADLYRSYAAACLRLAGNTCAPERAHWIEMARHWLQWAEDEDQRRRPRRQGLRKAQPLPMLSECQ